MTAEETGREAVAQTEAQRAEARMEERRRQSRLLHGGRTREDLIDQMDGREEVVTSSPAPPRSLHGFAGHVERAAAYRAPDDFDALNAVTSGISGGEEKPAEDAVIDGDGKPDHIKVTLGGHLFTFEIPVVTGDTQGDLEYLENKYANLTKQMLNAPTLRDGRGFDGKRKIVAEALFATYIPALAAHPGFIHRLQQPALAEIYRRIKMMIASGRAIAATQIAEAATEANDPNY